MYFMCLFTIYILLDPVSSSEQKLASGRVIIAELIAKDVDGSVDRLI
jgi:hypothetical protein